MKLMRARPSLGLIFSNIGADALSNDSQLSIAEHIEPVDWPVDVDAEILRGLLSEGMAREQDGRLDRTSTLDQWLAPRIHSALRLPRRVAADMGMWSWLVFEVGRRYTWRRWKEEQRNQPTTYRYLGDFKRNALARLWWFAEMSRNGADYSAIQNVLRDASTAQYAMELRYSMYRPAVIAFGNIAAQRKMGFDDLKMLSKRINAYLSLRSLEAIAVDEATIEQDREWLNDKPTLSELLVESLPSGPQDGACSTNAIDALQQWFDSLRARRTRDAA